MGVSVFSSCSGIPGILDARAPSGKELKEWKEWKEKEI
jgi:hypothetical protein